MAALYCDYMAYYWHSQNIKIPYQVEHFVPSGLVGEAHGRGLGVRRSDDDRVLSGGALSLGSSGAIGSTGNIVFSGGTLQYSTSNTTDYSSRIDSGTSTGAVAIDTNSQNVTFANGATLSNTSNGNAWYAPTITLSTTS